MMRIERFDAECVTSVLERQLAEWEMARENFFRLSECRRKPIRLGDLETAAQLNPARIRSTGAKVDSRSISERPCFLCAANRPAEQHTYQWLDGWELLVNPFPILPVHFTIASATHRPQDEIPIEMAAMAEQNPALTFFFNGAHAGASAPDHMHVQAVLTEELPLLRVAERYHSSSRPGFMSSEEFPIRLPFHFISAVVTPDAEGMRTLAKIPGAFGINAETGEADKGLVNAYFHIGADGLLRCVIVPRRRHRPSCYFKEGEDKILVSPGAIDMAGLVIMPREEDFIRATPEMISGIYGEVAFSDSLPDEIKEYFEISC